MPTMPLGDNRSEGAARHGPVTHHRRYGDAKQLVVDAVEDNRQRRQQHEQLLPVAPMAFVEQLADIDRSGCCTLAPHYGQVVIVQDQLSRDLTPDVMNVGRHAIG